MLSTVLLLGALLQAPADSGPVFDGRQHQLHIQIPRVEADVVVDGVLDEPVWQRAARLVGFSQYQPQDGVPAVEPTEVLVWYSPSAIYFGIRAREVHGDLVHATHADRDNIDADDYVQILLDTYNDRRRAFLFGVNPFGVQQDGVRIDAYAGGAGGASGGTSISALNVLNGNVDLNPDFIFQSRGRLVPGGYDVEIRIPFKSLRYAGGKVQTWGINVLRRVQHSGYQDSWAPAIRASASFINQSGWIDSLTDLRRGLVMNLTPVVTDRINGDTTGGGYAYQTGRAGAGEIQLGLDAHYGLTPNLSLDGTVKPDFSQVEADVGQVTLNQRFALFYPEKRPFFLDGLELLDSPNQLIYTRRIVSPDAGAKLAGKVGPWTIATIVSSDSTSESVTGSHPLFGITRLRYDLGPTSNLGFVGTTKEDGGQFSRLLDLDAHIVHNRIYFIELQGVATWTHDSSGFHRGTLTQATWDRTGRYWGFHLNATGIAPDFEAAAGFVNRTDIVNLSYFNRFTGYGAPGALLETVSSFQTISRIWSYNGFGGQPAIEGSESVVVQATLRGWWQPNLSLTRNFYDFSATSPGYNGTPYGSYRVLRAPGDTAAFSIPAGIDNLFAVTAGLTTPTWRQFTGTVSVGYGATADFAEAQRGTSTSLSGEVDLRPTPALRITAQYSRLVLHRRDGSWFSTEDIPRLKVEYQATRSIFFRVVGQYTALRSDALLDPATGDTLIVGGAAVGAGTSNELRVDWLFSYRPSPGTLIYLGYGASCSAFDAACAVGRQRSRTEDGFFAKLSYLFGL
ncbi:MAG TPA: DUF5916 domain-containing protein [Gemmatimonadales bacterium]|nr:DUF5916 domain-containing protein [Gemmatimonadales bacterium]